MKIIPLSEGSFTVDKTKQFVRFDEAEHELTDRPTGSLLVEIQPFLVVTSREVILLDSGLGFTMEDGQLQLHHNCRKAGIEPEEVTMVLLSHLHKDHAGGVGLEKPGSASQLSFPNAIYYVQETELAFAFEKGFPSFITEELECLRNDPRVHRLHGSGKISGLVSCEVTGAHSPHHQVFWIREGGETIFFGGDDAPQLQQMKHRFVAKYDHDGKKAMELRQQWWTKGKEEHWTFLFYHDIASPSYSF